MTRAWAVTITALSLLGVLSLIGLFIWASIVWGPYPILMLMAAVFAAFVIAVLVALARTIYRKVRPEL